MKRALLHRTPSGLPFLRWSTFLIGGTLLRVRARLVRRSRQPVEQHMRVATIIPLYEEESHEYFKESIVPMGSRPPRTRDCSKTPFSSVLLAQFQQWQTSAKPIPLRHSSCLYPRHHTPWLLFGENDDRIWRWVDQRSVRSHLAYQFKLGN